MTPEPPSKIACHPSDLEVMRRLLGPEVVLVLSPRLEPGTLYIISLGALPPDPYGTNIMKSITE